MNKKWVLVAVAAVVVTAAIATPLLVTEEAAAVTCTVSNRADWTWDQCAVGTTINVTNKAWVCRKPLASYGKLPIKVVLTANGPWSGANAGEFILSDGCSGPGGDDVALIVDSSSLTGAKTDTWGNGQDAVKYNGSTGPQNVVWTGEFQCGRIDKGAHQDALQMQAGKGNVLVNGVTGDWSDGVATCIGAGGMIFYSSANGHFPAPPTSIYGGHFLGCAKGLYGGNDINNGGGYPVQATGVVEGASFRTGRQDGTDPNCGTNLRSATPCSPGNTLVVRNLTCERWSRVAGEWTAAR